jgi:hypothetical protein
MFDRIEGAEIVRLTNLKTVQLNHLDVKVAIFAINATKGLFTRISVFRLSNADHNSIRKYAHLRNNDVKLFSISSFKLWFSSQQLKCEAFHLS